MREIPPKMNIWAVKKNTCAYAKHKINLTLPYATPIMLFTSFSSFVYVLKRLSL